MVIIMSFRLEPRFRGRAPALTNLFPAGRYVVESLDEAAELTLDEEEGLVQALDALRSGRGLEHEQVRDRILKRVRP